MSQGRRVSKKRHGAWIKTPAVPPSDSRKLFSAMLDSGQINMRKVAGAPCHVKMTTCCFVGGEP
jgi:hypothetical protein